MIKITSLNKFYNKNKENELHVINNVSIELPSSGLVSLIGKSGCGKTTLLNVIGGLDKANEGSIRFDDIRFDRYNMTKVDSFRKDNIGYIFQNYLLLEDKTVYENLKIALDLIQITDLEEQDKRIEYALKSVGMYNFRKKLAGRLSGGQQQRVSIARALIKQCKVIIADEPTGNLDSENTIEVMNILKKLSENTLVILVTHNNEIAKFYSDRIITISDGKIIDDKINHSIETSLNVSSDKKIYLKDLDNDKLENENIRINLFSDQSSLPVELNVIIKNNTIYIDTSSNIQLVKQSNIQLIDDHYKHLEKEQVKDYHFDISWYKETKTKNIFSRLFIQLKKSCIEFINTKKISKIFNAIFLVIGIAMASCIISVSNYKYMDTSSYSTENAYEINNPRYNIEECYGTFITKEEVYHLIDKGYIDNIYVTQPKYVSVDFTFNSNYAKRVSFLNNLYPYDKIDKLSLIVGDEPLHNEVVLGKELADKLLEECDLKGRYDLLIGLEIDNYIVSGVSSVNTNSVYYNSNVYYNFKLFFTDEYVSFDSTTLDKLNDANVRHKEYEDYTITNGKDITQENEILINDKFKELYHKTTYKDDLNSIYKVVGYFSGSEAMCIVSNQDLLGCEFSDEGFVHYALKNAEFILNQEHIDFKLDTLRNEHSRIPTEDNEILVSIYSAFEIGDSVHISGGEYEVVGYYHSKNVIGNNEVVISNKNTYLRFAYDMGENQGGCTYEISDENLTNIQNEGFDVYTPFEIRYKLDISFKEYDRNIQLLFVGMMLAISMIYVYFSNRSKLINEIREIGVYRSIGATRGQIIKRYVSNIFVNTTLTSILGYLIVTIGYSFISMKLSILTNTIAPVSASLLFAGMFSLYIINLIFGLIPIILLMKKTPAEIISKYDI
ncbi:MAG: ABC transporter ATP-binding protein/permease [Prevotella sp.]|nr:ABC transporter ATP-binding protein/permease [Staphylococcus sp.]MCM1350107.1 ABC transporter ATP-binding protein/permease [Prevotella sp.]